MENASDALKMAAAMFIFVLALSGTIYAFSKARDASASIMDKTDSDRIYYTSDNLHFEKIVGVDTVIANIYSYFQTQDTILFYTGDYNESSGQVSNIKPMILYYTEASDRLDSNNESYLTKSSLRATEGRVAVDPNYKDDNSSRGIYGLDLNDENTRSERWTESDEKKKQFVDSLIYRRWSPKFAYSLDLKILGKNRIVNEGPGNRFLQIGFYYQFEGSKPLIDLEGNFIERTGEYNYKALYNSESQYTTDDGGFTYGEEFNSTTQDQSIIVFDNDESIENTEGNKKRIIQYIYIGKL